MGANYYAGFLVGIKIPKEKFKQIDAEIDFDDFNIKVDGKEIEFHQGTYGFHSDDFYGYELSTGYDEFKGLEINTNEIHKLKSLVSRALKKNLEKKILEDVSNDLSRVVLEILSKETITCYLYLYCSY